MVPQHNPPQHTCPLQLLCQGLLRTMELKEECGCHRTVQFAVPVAGIHHDIVEKLWDQGEGWPGEAYPPEDPGGNSVPGSPMRATGTAV